MRVLVVSQHYWPESFRINDVVAALMREGCEVLVLTGQPNYPDGKIYPGYHAVAWGRTRHPDGYDIYRVPLLPRGSGKALRLIANYLSFILSASIIGPWLLRRKHIDIILVYGTSPILQAIAAIVIKWIKGARLVTWVQDLWPQSLEATGFVRDPRLLSGVAAVTRWIYRRCDLLLVQSNAFVEPVRAMAGCVAVEVHPNPGEAALEVSPTTEPVSPHLEPGFNIVFAGNLGAAQALETVVEAAERLRNHAEIRFVFVGSGRRMAWLQARVAERQLGNVSFLGRRPPQAMPGIFSQASALLVSLVDSPIMSLTVPSKVQAYLAAGRPIIASLDGEGARLVANAGAGLACPAEDATALADAVLKLYQLPDAERARMGASGRAYYRANFRSDVLAKRLIERFAAMERALHPELNSVRKSDNYAKDPVKEPN